MLTRGDLAMLGVTRATLRRLVASGQLEPLGQRSFRIAGSVADDRQRAHLAVLDSGGVLSHRDAAWLHGVGRFLPAPRPEVLVAGRSSGYRGGLATVHTSTFLPRDDLVVVEGIAVTSVARTLLSLAALVTKGHVALDAVRGAVDDAIRVRKASDKWLWWRLERLRRPGRDGVLALESILVHRAGGRATESWLEREFLALLARWGLPLPVCQRRISARGAFVARVDFLYPDLGLVIEVLGATHHASEEQLGRDAARRNELQLQGYTVIEFICDDVVRRPRSVAEMVDRARVARGARPALRRR